MIESIVRGTTPTHNFNLPIDTSELKTAREEKYAEKQIRSHINEIICEIFNWNGMFSVSTSSAYLTVTSAAVLIR